MGKIGVAFLKLLSSAPFWFLYALSDFLYFVIYRLIGYRKKVVKTNLKNSFPEKSEAEINQIMSDFYRFLCDLILESIKCFTISMEELDKRLKVHYPEEYRECVRNNESAIFVLGHYGNWEYAQLRFASIPEERQNFLGVYKKLGNKAMDNFLIDVRGRGGTELVEMKGVRQRIQQAVNEKEPFVLGLISDQSPGKERGYWMDFLNQDTPVFLGVERYARRLNTKVFFVNLDRTQRGHYEMHILPLVMDPANTQPGEITEIHTKHLEEIVRKKPELWLWSHKRWKHSRPSDLPAEQISTKFPGQ